MYSKTSYCASSKWLLTSQYRACGAFSLQKIPSIVRPPWASGNRMGTDLPTIPRSLFQRPTALLLSSAKTHEKIWATVPEIQELPRYVWSKSLQTAILCTIEYSTYARLSNTYMEKTVMRIWKWFHVLFPYYIIGSYTNSLFYFESLDTPIVTHYSLLSKMVHTNRTSKNKNCQWLDHTIEAAHIVQNVQNKN